jgi:PHAT
MSMKYMANPDEEVINVFMWLVDKALHHDALMQQTAHLKEFKYKMQRIKASFSHNKLHFNTSKGGANTKMRWEHCSEAIERLNLFISIILRWNTSKPLIKGNNQSMSSDIQPKIHRKSSMQYYNIQPYSIQNQSGNKSSSFPNFGSNQTSNISNFQRSASREKLNQFSLMQQQHQHQFNQQLPAQGGPPNPQAPPYHRHSLNNLMPFNSAQFINRRNSSCGTDRTLGHALLSPLGSHEKNLSDSGLSTSMNSTPSTASDINSRLESLCRQMTEQAIN